MSLKRAARVILIGAPGVGKGTQSERLLRRFPQLSAISSGDLLRDNVRNRTPLGTIILFIHFLLSYISLRYLKHFPRFSRFPPHFANRKKSRHQSRIRDARRHPRPRRHDGASDPQRAPNPRLATLALLTLSIAPHALQQLDILLLVLLR